MIRIAPTTTLRALATLLCMTTAQHAFAQDDPEKERSKHDAVERVVESHDTTLLLGGGRLMIKQAAVRSARKLLREWGKEAGLAGDGYELSFVESSNSVVIKGPVGLIAKIELIAEAFNKRNSGVRMIRRGKEG